MCFKLPSLLYNACRAAPICQGSRNEAKPCQFSLAIRFFCLPTLEERRTGFRVFVVEQINEKSFGDSSLLLANIFGRPTGLWVVDVRRSYSKKIAIYHFILPNIVGWRSGVWSVKFGEAMPNYLPIYL